MVLEMEIPLKRILINLSWKKRDTMRAVKLVRGGIK